MRTQTVGRTRTVGGTRPAGASAGLVTRWRTPEVSDAAASRAVDPDRRAVRAERTVAGAFCTQHRLNVGSFRGWLYELGRWLRARQGRAYRDPVLATFG